MTISRKQRVTIVRGISGAGKSTYISEHCPGAVIVSMDDLRTNERGEYRYDHSQIDEVRQRCFEVFEQALKDGHDVAVDNTNLTPKILRYVQTALSHGAEVEVVTINVDPKVAAARNVHGVPTDDVYKQHERLLKTLWLEFPEGVQQVMIGRPPGVESGMTIAQILAVVGKYKDKLAGRGIEAKRFIGRAILPTGAQALAHAQWVNERIAERQSQNELFEAHRMLGFVQGVLWVTGQRTLDKIEDDHKHAPS